MIGLSASIQLSSYLPPFSFLIFRDQERISSLVRTRGEKQPLPASGQGRGSWGAERFLCQLIAQEHSPGLTAPRAARVCVERSVTGDTGLLGEQGG